RTRGPAAAGLERHEPSHDHLRHRLPRRLPVLHAAVRARLPAPRRARAGRARAAHHRDGAPGQRDHVCRRAHFDGDHRAAPAPIAALGRAGLLGDRARARRARLLARPRAQPVGRRPHGPGHRRRRRARCGRRRPRCPRSARAVRGETMVLDIEYLGQRGAIGAFLIETDGGAAIVDPGPASALDGLRARLEEQGVGIADLEAILLTHIHLDHAGATGTLVRENPRLRVYVHERGAPHLADPARLLASATRLYGDQMERLWGEFLPVPPENLHVLAGGEDVQLGARRFETAYTPGHAVHHLSYLDTAEG